MTAVTATKSLGSVVKVDNGSGTFIDVGGVQTITPPARVRELIDKTLIADTLETMLAGIEKSSSLDFVQEWSPDATGVQRIDALMDSGAETTWELIFPFATPKTYAFTGIVESVTQPSLSKSSLYTRTVKVHRNSVFTVT